MLSLENVTTDNWSRIIWLTTDPERRCPLDEEWMLSTAFSLVQAAYEPGWHCRAIRLEDTYIGFALYGWWPEKAAPLLCRYMIDVRHQGKGLGQQALPLVLDDICHQYGPTDIYLTVEENNLRAVHLYTKFSFVPTGEADEGETVYVRRRPHHAS